MGTCQPELTNAKRYKSVRGQGGFVRSNWDEVCEIIAAANAFTIKNYGPGPRGRLLADPGDVDGQLRAGSRYLSLIGGCLLSFYDWYLRFAAVQPAGLG